MPQGSSHGIPGAAHREGANQDQETELPLKLWECILQMVWERFAARVCKLILKASGGPPADWGAARPRLIRVFKLLQVSNGVVEH